ncbi:hypothetical protein DM785_05100 [Deinococcus actinosclerus]|nr:hypothetical protein DM785_05100 [Deinococcus actinosclerus]
MLESNAVWLQLSHCLPDGQVARCAELADRLTGHAFKQGSLRVQQLRHGPEQQRGECDEGGSTQGGVDVLGAAQAAGDGGGRAEFLHGLSAGLLGTEAGQGELPGAFGEVVEQFSLGVLSGLAVQAAGGLAHVLFFRAHANSR